MFDTHTHACEPSQMLLLNQLGTYYYYYYKYDDDVSMHFPRQLEGLGVCYVFKPKHFRFAESYPTKK
jgi:hypothetical protein